MYQPEDNGLATYEIPTARETAPTMAQPPHGCPDTPGRECMLRYLYANKHHHMVKCATCGIISSKVSAFQRGKKAKAERLALTGMSAADRKREYNRQYEEKRKAARRAKLEARTPEDIEADRQKRIAALNKGRETQKLKAPPKTREEKIAAQREYRAAKKAEKLAAMTPAEREAWEQEKRDRALASLAKANAVNAARREAKREAAKGENAERVKAKLEEKRRLKNEANAARYSLIAAEREPALRASLELARAGKKPPNRCEAVTLALEWMLDAGIQEVAMLDFLPAVNKWMHKKVANSGALGRSVRDYGLTVRTEYRGKGIIKSFLYLDDKAREFVGGGFVKHGRISR